MPKTAKRRRGAAAPSQTQPARLQVGALCWRRGRKGLRILLITSRDTGRWIIPKGWPMRNRSDADAAAREAYEEAGLQGRIAPRSIGVYTYQKALRSGAPMPCVVRVFTLEVHKMLQTFPEDGQRRTRWFSPSKAAKRVAEPDLKGLIRGFDPDAPDPAPSSTPPASEADDD